MNCRTIRRKDIIEDYLAHRLGEALADEFEAHLLGCSRCSTLLEYMQSLRDGLEERASSIRTAISKEIAKSEDRQLIRASASFKRRSASSALIVTLKEAEQSLAAEKKTIEAQAGEVKKQLEAGSAARESDFLRGWDAIASYLHCEVRFLLRWATNLALPVYEQMDSVYAYKSGIDTWLRQQGFDPNKDELDTWLSQRGFEVAQDESVRKPNEEDLPLRGWQEIAGFLGRDVRIVQLWERSLGFPPVRRDLSGPGSVYAYKSEINAWLTQRGFDPKKNKLDAWLKRRGEILSRGTDTLDRNRTAALKMFHANAAFRFPQEQATTEEKTKKPSKQ